VFNPLASRFYTRQSVSAKDVVDSSESDFFFLSSLSLYRFQDSMSPLFSAATYFIIPKNPLLVKRSFRFLFFLFRNIPTTCGVPMTKTLYILCFSGIRNKIRRQFLNS
jgi:hypothetical protein